MKKVAMIGVGKLGQDCAEVMAEHYNVVGYDVAPRTPSNFEMRPSIEEAVKDRDIIFIAAPTAHDPIYGGETPTSHLPNKDFDYSIVTDILNEVNKHANKNQLVVLISTVLPGTVRRLLEPCITNARFIYNPYLIAMGTVKWDMVNPEMVIIGTDDGSLTGDAQELIEFYKVFMQNNPRYEVGTWDEAESIKIFYNTFISTKLALVNMIQDVAETNGNIDVDVVANALAKSDYRIMGPAYMKPGMGDAGACHPRDNIALRYLAERLDLGYDLFDSIMLAREVQAERMAKTCLEHGPRVCIIGKAYKPGVHYTNGSYSLLVGHYIEKHGGQVSYYDKHTGDSADLSNQDVYLIGYWEQWVEEMFSRNQFDIRNVVIDPWRRVDNSMFNGPIVHYGNTRPKSKKKLIEERRGVAEPTFLIWPELQKYDHRIHFIPCGPSYDFFRTSNVEIANAANDAIDQGRDLIFFFDISEPASDPVTKKVNSITKMLKVPVSNVYYLSLAMFGKESYNKVCQRLNIEPVDINVLSSNTYLKVTQDSVEPKPYNVAIKPKKFLTFNKNHRLQRAALISKLIEKNLLDTGFCSMYGSWGCNDWIEQVAPFLDSLEPRLSLNLINNKHRFPLHLNANAETRGNPLFNNEEDLFYYENSYYSVVTETLFFSKRLDFQTSYYLENDVFFSEKTYKAIAGMHPFILVASQGLLKHLKGLGFKTFHPFIDESYDDETDDYKRLNMIVSEMERLNSFTDEQWLEWQRNIAGIVEYNYQFFKSHRDYRITKDINIK